MNLKIFVKETNSTITFLNSKGNRRFVPKLKAFALNYDEDQGVMQSRNVFPTKCKRM